MGGFEVAVDDLLDLFGQFGGDGFFGAAQDIAGGLGAQAFVVPTAFITLEAGGQGGEVAGHQEGEEGTQILQRVFQRRAGEQEASAGVEGAERLRVAGAAVFNVLGFVGDDAAEGGAGKQLFVARQRPVGRDDEVVGAKGFRIGQALFAVVHKDAQFGGEASGFAAPVFHERSRADDERDRGTIGAADGRGL